MNLNPFIDLIITILELYNFVLLAWVIVSLLISFDIVNRHNQVVYKISEALYKMTEPLLRRIRRYMPDFGGIDISPIVVFLAIRFLINFLQTYFYSY